MGRSSMQQHALAQAGVLLAQKDFPPGSGMAKGVGEEPFPLLFKIP